MISVESPINRGKIQRLGAAFYTYSCYVFQPSRIRFFLFICFLLSIVTFPLGQAFRVGGPLVCLPLLLLLYWKDWKNSTLRTIPIRWLFILFALSLSSQIIFSHWIAISWDSVRPNIFRGCILVFIGMETVRSERDLRWLIYVFAITFFYEGIDGIWQALTGKDYIKDTPVMSERLTGSLGTYRVGNYMSIIALPAFGIWMLLPIKNKILFLSVISIVLFPGVFLWIGAVTRIGYVGLFLGGYILWLCIWTHFSWRKLFIFPIIGLSLVLFIEGFFVSWRSIFSDPRIKIWEKALKVGREHFWFGTGSSTFMVALEREEGASFFSRLGHPHNIYIQFFIDGGIVGLSCSLIFFLGITYWTWTYINKGVYAERAGQYKGFYWRLTSFFWGGWVTYLITGLGAHDFYRTWWLAIAATILGILLGACWCGESNNS